MEVLRFGELLLWAAAALTGAIILLSLLGLLLRQRRFVVSARTGFYALFVLVAGSAACLVHGFLTGVYNNDYIFNYSEKELEPFFKFAGLWAGLDGSLLFWTLLLSAACAVAAFQHHWSSRHPSGRRMEPYTYLVMGAIVLFFITLSISFSPFQEMDFERRMRLSEHYRIPLDAQGNLTDGAGLNPQLVNYWFVIHPPNLYMGFVIFTIPFAFAMAALMSRELGDYWIRITRRWAMVSWLFLTCGVILGGLWAYRQLGWGGYWAWDPVENASFLPWCFATAFLHSIMIQERRDMLKWWNVFLIICTFFFTIEATYMTRSGEVASVHAFAGGNIGVWFRIFKLVLVGASLVLLFYRFRELRGAHRLESFLSREAAFFVNNLVLVAIALSVWFLSWGPTNSHHYLPGIRSLLPETWQEYFPAQVTFGPPAFNVFMMPLLALLLFLTAVGPGLGWVRTSGSSLRRNFLGPLVFSVLAVPVLYALLLLTGAISSVREIFLLPKAALFIFLAALIVGTVGHEFLRGMKSRIRFRNEGVLTAFFNLISRDNRRYGGYTVHIGIAVLTFGIVVSSMFKEEKQLTVKMGHSEKVGPYVITPVEANRSPEEVNLAVSDLRTGRRTLEELQPGFPYLIDQVFFRVSRVRESGGMPVAHGEASREGSDEGSAAGAQGSAAEGEVVCELHPERRFYPRQNGGQGNWIKEVSIHRKPLEDIYLYFHDRDSEDRVRVDVHLNPLMMAIWVGWFIMVFGALFALLPISGSRVGLSE